MTAFDHVVLLLSFVYALALTHLLSRVGALIQARERVRFSGLLALAMTNAVGLLYLNWLELWDMHDNRVWTLFEISVQFLFAVSQYFLCALVAPDAVEEGDTDMKAFYWHNRRLIYWTLLGILTLAVLGNTTFLETPRPDLFLKENALNLAFVVPVLLPLTIIARWAQWLGGSLLLFLLIISALAFTSVLH